MRIEECVCHALGSEPGVVLAMPGVHDAPAEELAGRIDAFLARTEEALTKAVSGPGLAHLARGDAAGLCMALLDADLRLPPEVLFAVCRAMVEFYPLEVSFRGDAADGAPVFSVRMAVGLGEP